ncbi:MAG: sigma-70 family RNA polymerase sigma factor [Archangiaceae bacterium]|nr:sigma-70 family RNA polymerase sigma factor [Archangiaceae bacterium]
MALTADLTALYRAEFSYVWTVLYRLGARGSDREDLAQEVFAAAFKQWERYDRARAVRPWLFGISYRLVRDFRRKHQHRFEESTPDVTTENGNESAEDAVARKQGLALALRGLETLELERRAVFVMHDLDEHPMPVIAAELGIPLNTAYSRLRLARRDFNEFVARLNASNEVLHG